MACFAAREDVMLVLIWSNDMDRCRTFCKEGSFLINKPRSLSEM